MAFRMKLTLVASLLLLTACRSDPISFHTLVPAQPGSRSVSGDIHIEGLSVPPQVDRPQLVIRQGNSGLAILETEWWAASLADELRSSLADQLTNNSRQRKISLRVDVQRFDSIPGQYGLIEAKWRLRSNEASALLSCHSTFKTPSGPLIDELVAAQQNNVKRLATAISQAANGMQNGCPVTP